MVCCDDAAARSEGLEALSELVGAAYGDDGARVGEEVRATNVIPSLCAVAGDRAQESEAREQALYIIANLCSQSVDPHSALTKAAVLRSGGAEALLSCIRRDGADGSDDGSLLLLAAGCLQNVGISDEWAEHLVHLGAHRDIEALLACGDPAVVRYASGGERVRPSNPQQAAGASPNRPSTGGLLEARRRHFGSGRQR